jgi:hypothetical protein
MIDNEEDRTLRAVLVGLVESPIDSRRARTYGCVLPLRGVA